MSADSIIQKYSLSLFEACEENKKTEAVASELTQAVGLFVQPDVSLFFTSPFNASDNKIMVAKSALEGKCSPEVFNFIIMLVKNDRMAFLSDINEAFQTLVRAKSGETEGVLTVASDVSEQFKVQVEAQISKQLSKKVKLTVKKDPTLLSGYKISVAGWVFDDSAQFHISKIKEEISKRGI